jgi:ABC-type polysaccharide/polyol phosphate transport system ATPase subunit
MSYDVRCVNLGKRYRLQPRAPRFFGRVTPPQVEEFWALRNVSFDVAPGETFGVIGPNGAGKSTLLKLLSSITAPTEGEIRIRGRIAALIEVGSGFHPELTGRENVFLSGTILGMRRREIAQRLDSIVDFAGIGGFIDVPVKWYSSGMYVRLGFAVAAHLEADVLLVDEVLAVGDAEFQARCLRRIHELRERGTTIIFISHDLGTVERMCRRAVLFRRGALIAEGDARDIVTRYQQTVTDTELVRGESSPEPARPLAIRSLRVVDANGAERGVARTGDAVRVELGLHAMEPVENAVAEVKVYSHDEGVLLFECRTPETGVHLIPGNHVLRFEIDALGLLPGAYTLGAIVRSSGAARAVDWWFGRTTLHVDSGPTAAGLFHTPYRWSVDSEPSGTAEPPRRSGVASTR